MNVASDHEKALCGVLLAAYPEALDDCRDAGLTLNDFDGPLSRVYGACMELHVAGRPVDLVSVCDRLSSEALDALGGHVAMNRLVDAAPPPAHARYHAGKILEYAIKRRLAARLSGWMEAAKNGTTAPELLADIRSTIDAEERTSANDDLAGTSLADLADSEIDRESTLLGQNGVRYLCRGGAMLFVGPSGVGKSTAAVQQDILWSLGRPAFGITPARPVRIVTVQAENDAGDLIHMAHGIMHALSLSAEDRVMVKANTLYLSHNGSTGPDFLAFLRRVLRKYKPDLLRIDPLMAYAGGDLTKPETTATFCRNGLNRLATQFNCGIVACHHTPKMTGSNANSQARKNWGAFDWQYAAAGGADLANWARAVLVIEPLSRDVFAFRAAKRWPGWKNAEGAPEHVRFFQREREQGKVYWHDATPGDAAAAEGSARLDKGPDLEALQETAAALVKKPMSPGVLKDQMRQKMGLTKNKAETMLTMLTGDGGLLIRWPIEVFPKQWLVGTPEQRKNWESPSLPSQLSQPSHQDGKEDSVADLSSQPPLRGGRTGQQHMGSNRDR